MKKWLSFLLIFAMLASCFTIGLSAAYPDKKGKVTKAVKGTPTIDGVVDDIWKNAVEESYTVAETPDASATPAKATFRSMWDENYLYLLYVVEDSTMGNKEHDDKITTGNFYNFDGMGTMLSPNYNRVTSGSDLQMFFFIGSFGKLADSKADKGGKTDGVLEYIVTQQKGSDDKYTGYTIELKLDLKKVYPEMKMEKETCVGFDSYSYDNYYKETGTNKRNAFFEWANTDAKAHYDDTRKGTIVFLNTKDDPIPEAPFDPRVPDPGAAVTKAVKGTPVIDGTIDEVWNDAKVEKIEKVNYSNAAEGVTPASASFRTLWDENYLYLLCEVSDTTMKDKAWEDQSKGGNLYKRDGLIFSIAPKYNRDDTSNVVAPSFYFMIGAFGNTANWCGAPEGVFLAETDQEGNKTPNFSISYLKDNDGNCTGYVLELKVNLKLRYADYKAEDGTCIGFDVALCDNYATKDSANRDTLKSWNDGAKSPTSSKSDAKKGTIQLVDPSTPDSKGPVTYAAKGTPVIDGQIDELWAKAKEEKIENFITKNYDNPATATFRTMWDENYLYFLFVVNDPTMFGPYKESTLTGDGTKNYYMVDGVSLMFSPDYDRSTTENTTAPAFWFIIGAFGTPGNYNSVPANVFIGDVDQDGKLIVDENKKPKYPNYALSYYPGAEEDTYAGYVLELKVDLKAQYDKIKMKAGTCIGFDTYLNDNCNGSTRDVNRQWSNSKGVYSYKDNAQKGTIQLLDVVEDPSALPPSNEPEAPEPVDPGDETTNQGGEDTKKPPVTTTGKEEPTAKPEESTTADPNKNENKGCASAVGTSAILVVGLLSMGAVAITKKRKK